MKEVLEKISSYNIFNFLVPGILFVILCKAFIGYNFVLDNDFLGAFLYYFIGSVISRIGSLIIEPLLRKTKFLKFADYKDYIEASKKDEKIDILSEVNNSYRTILAMTFFLFVVKIYSWAEVKWNISREITYYLIATGLLIMFLFAYKKQTNFITKRIEATV